MEKKGRWNSCSSSLCFCLFFTRDARMLWSSASVVTRLQSVKLRERERERGVETDRHQVLPRSPKASSQGDKCVLLLVAGKSDLRVPED